MEVALIFLKAEKKKKFNTAKLSHRFDFGLSRIPITSTPAHLFPFAIGRILSAFFTMFKPSQPMMARLRLTTKQVNGGYYKGNRTGSMGYFNRSSYIIDLKKVRRYVVPEELDQFPVSLAKYLGDG